MQYGYYSEQMEKDKEQQEELNKSQIDAPTDFEEDLYSDLKSNCSWDDLGVPQPLADRLIQLGFKFPSKIQELILEYES